MALATVMITFRTSVQVVFFVFESILIVVFCGLIMRFVFVLQINRIAQIVRTLQIKSVLNPCNLW